MCNYFTNHHKYNKIYGTKSILLMQVGHFHEAYQTDTEGPNLDAISDITGVIRTKKNKSIKETTRKSPYMLGFPSFVLNKYIKLLIDESYSVIIFDQFDLPDSTKKTRKLVGIYSKGTYIDDLKSDSNYMMSIYIEENEDYKYKNMIICSGISLIDLSTGKIYINEFFSTKNDDKYSLDDTVKLINSYDPSEILLCCNNLKSITQHELIQYLELSNRNYHIKSFNKEYNKGSVQKELLEKIYKDDFSDMFEDLELNKYSFIRYSLISLIKFIEEHNEFIIAKLKEPEFIEKEKYLYLGNNALQQLNIFHSYSGSSNSSKQDYTGKYSSLYDIINFCSTPMGKRFLKESLINPLVDPIKINNRYEMIDTFIKKGYNEIEIYLNGINDIERLQRKIAIKLIDPIDLNKWINSMNNIINLKELIDSKKYNLKVNYDINELKNCLTYINTKLKVDELSNYTINDIETNIFKLKQHVELDELQDKINLCKNLIDIIKNKLNDIMFEKIKVNDVVKVEHNERDGYFLILTKKRSEVLKKELDTLKSIQFKIGNDNLVIKTDAFEFRNTSASSTATTTKIFISDVNKKSDELIIHLSMMKKKCKIFYQNFLEDFYNEFKYIMNDVSYYVSLVDFIKSGAKCAEKYYYNKPIIKNDAEKSYIKSHKIRHPIVERISENEYKPMNISVGINGIDGILLYGLNSAGKSTLQKSVGINLILAQIGYYVSAESFEYQPYKSLFTRISGNDNLFKGLSSFALEIVELSGILKRSGQNTLVIADEVCRGTEYKSSIVIVMTMIDMLSKSQTSFITASHLHKLIKLDRMKEIKNVKPYHIHISYDEQSNTLTYDRELKEGVGEEFYGLNVAKCLINDNSFIEIANQIKKEIDYKKNKSRYNKSVIMECCSICKNQPEGKETSLETHHIVPQKDCKNKKVKDKEYLSMNHPTNLCVLCQSCHDEVDRKNLIINGYKETSDGLVLDYYWRKSKTSNL
jgi:DNA mismatch repair protein MutS